MRKLLYAVVALLVVAALIKTGTLSLPNTKKTTGEISLTGQKQNPKTTIQIERPPEATSVATGDVKLTAPTKANPSQQTPVINKEPRSQRQQTGGISLKTPEPEAIKMTLEPVEAEKTAMISTPNPTTQETGGIVLKNWIPPTPAAATPPKKGEPKKPQVVAKTQSTGDIAFQLPAPTPIAEPILEETPEIEVIIQKTGGVSLRIPTKTPKIIPKLSKEEPQKEEPTTQATGNVALQLVIAPTPAPTKAKPMLGETPTVEAIVTETGGIELRTPVKIDQAELAQTKKVEPPKAEAKTQSTGDVSLQLVDQPKTTTILEEMPKIEAISQETGGVALRIIKPREKPERKPQATDTKGPGPRPRPRPRPKPRPVATTHATGDVLLQLTNIPEAEPILAETPEVELIIQKTGGVALRTPTPPSTKSTNETQRPTKEAATAQATGNVALQLLVAPKPKPILEETPKIEAIITETGGIELKNWTAPEPKPTATPQPIIAKVVPKSQETGGVALRVIKPKPQPTAKPTPAPTATPIPAQPSTTGGVELRNLPTKVVSPIQEILATTRETGGVALRKWVPEPEPKQPVKTTSPIIKPVSQETGGVALRKWEPSKPQNEIPAVKPTPIPTPDPVSQETGGVALKKPPIPAKVAKQESKPQATPIPTPTPTVMETGGIDLKIPTKSKPLPTTKTTATPTPEPTPQPISQATGGVELKQVIAKSIENPTKAKVQPTPLPTPPPTSQSTGGVELKKAIAKIIESRPKATATATATPTPIPTAQETGGVELKKAVMKPLKGEVKPTPNPNPTATPQPTPVPVSQSTGGVELRQTKVEAPGNKTKPAATTITSQETGGIAFKPIPQPKVEERKIEPKPTPEAVSENTGGIRLGR